MKVTVNDKLLQAVCNDLQSVDGYSGMVHACPASQSDSLDMGAIIAIFCSSGFVDRDIQVYKEDCGMADILILHEQDTDLFRFMFRVDSGGSWVEPPSSDYVETNDKFYPPTKSFVQLIDFIGHHLFSQRMAMLHDDRQWYKSQETRDLLMEGIDPMEIEHPKEKLLWVDASKELPKKSGKYIVECVGAFKLNPTKNKVEAHYFYDDKTKKGTFDISNQTVMRWLKETPIP